MDNIPTVLSEAYRTIMMRKECGYTHEQMFVIYHDLLQFADPALHDIKLYETIIMLLETVYSD